ncbi:uncharacterized protein LOC126746616 isoform X2 [Anthonomus grandis grandis]|uniref:uncharacterized protein LOC126746616 isoform X2 n=1 Tax=Anthonomus grandis grandis TaxID=2921223 RepID=UPI0021658E88|nr:uncharacterized protein LOC126746616 isoform X2 [Anthonomus grandis grandis]
MKSKNEYFPPMYLGVPTLLCLSTNKVLSIEKPRTMEFATNPPLLRPKRSSEIDLQTCIDNFNVHRDKIIRTQDSQNMGAKYLNEIDLGSREECLRLCCETVDCDVFVFEEKNAGSCYLFHCGPPEDFKCKFTHHVNYSSAVLSINRRVPDLESQIKLTKHIQDLTKLRKPEGDSQSEVIRTDEVKATSTQAPVITKEVIPVEKQPEAARKCSRYQFECRSTGDCIAIYNACDGIPQCADASDEGHELGCPAPEAVLQQAQPTVLAPPLVATKKAPAPPTMPDPAQQQQYGREGGGGELLVQQQPASAPIINKPQQGLMYQNPVYHGQQQQQPPPHQIGPQISPEGDFLRPVSDPLRGAPLMPNYLGFGNNWAATGGRQPPPYQDTSGAIYPRKETGPQSEVNQLQYPEYPAARLGNYYGDNYRQPESWPMDDSRYQQPLMFHPQESIPLVPVKPEETSRIAEGDHEKPLEPVVNSKHIQEKLAHDLKHSKEHMEHGQSQKSKPTEREMTSHPELVYPEPYRLIDDTQDGLSHIPRGAILSLTLGLIITAVMAVLIGCRLRVVRRRLRKGGKGYAHDADYLVNGMYL